MLAAKQAIVAIAVLTLGLGTALAGHGIYLAAKARLAQALLSHAWEQTRRTGTPHRPWPWADTQPVARLRVPRYGIDEIVLAGSSGRTLAFGPGLVPGTSLPGGRGLSMISGHRDTHFQFLEDLRVGDALYIQRAGRRPDATYRYVVTRFMTIDLRKSVPALDPTADQLVLVTCYPFHQWTAGGPGRYLVIARPAPQRHRRYRSRDIAHAGPARSGRASNSPGT